MVLQFEDINKINGGLPHVITRAMDLAADKYSLNLLPDEGRVTVLSWSRDEYGLRVCRSIGVTLPAAEQQQLWERNSALPWG